MNLNEWRLQSNDLWKVAKQFVTEEKVVDRYHLAMESMATLNLNAASLMKKYDCHGATDVTGFGIYGHAKNLVEVQ